jgi:hypothetical protein
MNPTPEEQVLKALNVVKSYKVLRNGDVALLDANQAQALLLQKRVQ